MKLSQYSSNPVVDMDLGVGSNHQQSITVIIIKHTGVTIFFKTKFQETFDTSSTEADTSLSLTGWEVAWCL